jgi:hypothetical protein
MKSLIKILTNFGLLKDDLDYHFGSRIDGHHIFVFWLSEMV